MRKIVFSLAASLAAFCASADFPFSDFGAGAAWLFSTDYLKYPKALTQEYGGNLSAHLTMVDGNGEKITAKFDVDSEDIEGSVESALEGLRSTVNTATINAARALAQNAIIAECVTDNASKIQSIQNSLYSIFTELSKLELKNPDDGTSKELPMKVDGDRVYIVGNFAQPVKVDGISITSNNLGQIQLGRFDTEAQEFMIPYKGVDGSLVFSDISTFFDPDLFAKYDEILTSLSIRGFYQNHTLGSSYGFCADSLALQLTRAADDHSHFMLSAYNDGGTWKLHYTPVGTLSNLNANVETAWSWDAQNKTFKNTWVQVGRSTVEALGVGSNLGDGSYHVAVDMENGTAMFSSGVAPASTDSTTYFNVGTVSGGRLTSGIHSMPVCVYWE